MIDLRDILRAMRKHLGLDVAFVNQFVGERRLFRYVDAALCNGQVQEGQSGPLDESYCKLVVERPLPEPIPDTSASAVSAALPQTRELPVGAHVSVPIRMSDGAVFGTFCCFGYEARGSLNERDLATVRTFADITASRIEQDLLCDQRQLAKRQRIEALIASGGPQIVYQPVFMLDDLRIAGTEALSRFPDAARPVDAWFKDAAEVGLQVEFELLAIGNALRGYRDIWREHPVQLGLNASAATVCDDRFWDVLDGQPHDLIVIELTEHEQVHDYESLLAATKRLRASGTKIAIDDVGAGYASMRHVLTIRPDIIKLDVGLTRSIDADDLRVALISSLKHFADHFACRVVAEGIETQEELLILQRLGLQAAQGYWLARPETSQALLDRLTPRPAMPHPARS